MVDKRNIGRDLSRLEDHIDDPDAGDRVDAYWEALAAAVRDAEAAARAGDDDIRPRADLPDLLAFFPVGYDRDDALAAFDAEDATWGDAAKRAAKRQDPNAVPGDQSDDGGDTSQ